MGKKVENSYTAYQAEYRRFMLLKLLADFPSSSGNCDILQMSLIDLGLPCAYEDVLKDLNFLAEHELINLSDVGPYKVAELSRAGGDVAARRTYIKGIRPSLSGFIPALDISKD